MLAHGLPDRITYKDRTYRINLAFDVVLRVFEVTRDKLLDPAEQVGIALEMLAGRKAARRPIEDQVELFKRIVSGYISSNGSDDTGPRVFDFEQDAEYIIAAFRQAYNIDLIEMRGRLDWRIFIALFKGLPDGTRMREIMNVRGRPVPVSTKHNQEEIRALQKAKAFYALKIDPEEAEKTFQAALDKFAAKF